jgi:hypothetical protein
MRYFVLPDLRAALWACRLQLVVVVFLFIFLSIGQGRDLAISLQLDRNPSIILGLLSAGILAVQVWVWSYIAVTNTQKKVSSKSVFARAVRRAMPLYVAGSLTLMLLSSITYTLYHTGDNTGALALSFSSMLAFAAAISLARGILTDGSQALRLPSLCGILSVTCGVLIITIWGLYETEITRSLGSFGTTFLAIAALLPIASAIVVSRSWKPIPIVTVLLVAPLFAETVYGILGFKIDRYAIRVLKDDQGRTQGVPSPELSAATASWRANNDRFNQLSPVVFVTAAGGGIRAAYWASAVLGRLQDCIPNFHRKIISLSGVSGGSLGVATFGTLVSRNSSNVASIQCDHPIQWEAQPVGRGRYQEFLRNVHSDDFLAPVIREMFLVDTFRSLLPWASSDANRAVALERAWELSWARACKKSMELDSCRENVLLSDSWSKLAEAGSNVPMMFLNGVHQETGKRIVTSTVKVDRSIIVDAIDLRELVNHDLRISTAILNSARFPFVSPSGALLRYGDDGVRRMGHVIDGGYFDNNGTLTSNEVAVSVLENLQITRSLGDSCDGPSSRRVLFLELLNDTSMSDEDAGRVDDSWFNDEERNREGYLAKDVNIPARQLVTAFLGLEATRSARAVHASKTLAKFAENATCNKKYIQIRLCADILPDPPLGWTLSAESRSSIDAMITGHGNRIDLYQRSKKASRLTECYTDLQDKLGQVISFLR